MRAAPPSTLMHEGVGVLEAKGFFSPVKLSSRDTPSGIVQQGPSLGPPTAFPSQVGQWWGAVSFAVLVTKADRVALLKGQASTDLQGIHCWRCSEGWCCPLGLSKSQGAAGTHGQSQRGGQE